MVQRVIDGIMILWGEFFKAECKKNCMKCAVACNSSCMSAVLLLWRTILLSHGARGRHLVKEFDQKQVRAARLVDVTGCVYQAKSIAAMVSV
ncbi:hypothetical protein ATN79_46940 [Paraburkholderia caribensis]|nr:hypothetical protein ATN79_46940 [Paraburkholderia caribensis]